MSVSRHWFHRDIPFDDLKREMVENLLIHEATANLVDAFASILLLKLAKAERKHGYSDDWKRLELDDLIAQAREHVTKGDPRDVAAYAMFMWWHNLSMTNLLPEAPGTVAATPAAGGDQ